MRFIFAITCYILRSTGVDIGEVPITLNLLNTMSRTEKKEKRNTRRGTAVSRRKFEEMEAISVIS